MIKEKSHKGGRRTGTIISRATSGIHKRDTVKRLVRMTQRKHIFHPLTYCARNHPALGSMHGRQRRDTSGEARRSPETAIFPEAVIFLNAVVGRL
jgi:hypothetical protein